MAGPGKGQGKATFRNFRRDGEGLRKAGTEGQDGERPGRGRPGKDGRGERLRRGKAGKGEVKRPGRGKAGRSWNYRFSRNSWKTQFPQKSQNYTFPDYQKKQFPRRSPEVPRGLWNFVELPILSKIIEIPISPEVPGGPRRSPEVPGIFWNSMESRFCRKS